MQHQELQPLGNSSENMLPLHNGDLAGPTDGKIFGRKATNLAPIIGGYAGISLLFAGLGSIAVTLVLAKYNISVSPLIPMGLVCVGIASGYIGVWALSFGNSQKTLNEQVVKQLSQTEISKDDQVLMTLMENIKKSSYNKKDLSPKEKHAYEVIEARLQLLARERLATPPKRTLKTDAYKFAEQAVESYFHSEEAAETVKTARMFTASNLDPTALTEDERNNLKTYKQWAQGISDYLANC